MGMTIEFLADHPEALALLARWQHAEWGDLREGDSIEARQARLQSYSNRDRIPLTVVARDASGALTSIASSCVVDFKSLSVSL